MLTPKVRLLRATDLALAKYLSWTDTIADLIDMNTIMAQRHDQVREREQSLATVGALTRGGVGPLRDMDAARARRAEEGAGGARLYRLRRRQPDGTW